MMNSSNKYYLCCFICFFFCVHNYYANGIKVLDSLNNELNKVIIDSSKAKILLEISDYYNDESNYQKSIESSLKALKIYEKLGKGSQAGNVLNSIGASYYYMQNWEKAIEYWNDALQLAVNGKNIEDQVRFMNNIGLIYEKQGAFQKALEYNKKTLALKEQIGDSLSISRTLSNIGSVYYNLKKYEKALDYFKKSLKIKRIYVDDKKGFSNVLQNIGYAYSHLNKYKLASQYVSEGLEVAKEANNLYQQQDAYIKLGDIYIELKQFRKASQFYVMAIKVKDSLNQINNAKLIAEMDAKFEAEKKDNEIALQQVEIEKQNTEVQLQTTQKIWFAIGLFLSLVLLFVAYRGIKQKQQANKMLEEKNNIIEEKNKDITDSITYASNIQQSILPDSSLISKSLPNHFIFFKPKDIVSGDFYWFHEKEDYLFIMAADCTGHGVPGAFVSMLCNNLLNQIIIEKNFNTPGEILTEVNNAIKQSFSHKNSTFTSSDGMDCSLCVIEKKTNRIEYAGAYNQLIYIRDKNINEVKADRTPIGGRTKIDYQFTTHKISTKPGDSIYLFSDGYADQFGGPKGKKFMIKNLKEMFMQIHNYPHPEQNRLLDETLMSWKGDNEQVDDILIVGFKI